MKGDDDVTVPCETCFARKGTPAISRRRPRSHGQVGERNGPPHSNDCGQENEAVFGRVHKSRRASHR
jgi:hypothetical protein